MRRSQKIAYSLAELEEMSGLSKRRIERALSSNNVQFHYVGAQRKRLVFLSDLEVALPSLVDSVRFRGDEE